MSKNFALNLLELVDVIVFTSVVPDWECKSAAFFLPTKHFTKVFLKYY
ncbi:hypothetical protein [Dyadobacter sp. NIV53]|nr:hypothetical protein [Dyadobacter sp. NIV53]